MEMPQNTSPLDPFRKAMGLLNQHLGQVEADWQEEEKEQDPHPSAKPVIADSGNGQYTAGCKSCGGIGGGSAY